MTLVAVWIRKNDTLRELVIAADSRVSGGELWDACPKVLPISRPATAVAMSGEATQAYAFLLQVMNTCALLDGHSNGRTDIGNLAQKVKRVFADSREHVTDLPLNEAQSTPTLDVVMAGWSWRRSQFEGYSYSYERNGRLLMKPLAELRESTAYGVYFAGDAAQDARTRLAEIQAERGLTRPRRGDPNARETALACFLNWEPLEVLLNMIDDRSVRTVGGVPQLLRMYQYGHTETFVWRDALGIDHYGGRRLMPNERFDRRIITFDGRAVNVSHSDRSIMAAGGLPSEPDLLERDALA